MLNASKKLSLPDGSQLELPADATLADAALKIGPRLAKSAIAGKADGQPVDLSFVPADGAAIEIITPATPAGLDVLRHSAAHIMAEAVAGMFPDAKMAIGPTIADGFYYDFDLPRAISAEDLPEIEKRMKNIIAANKPFQRRDVSRQEAITIFREKNQTFKVELLEELKEDSVSTYEQGDFLDLCRGPHLPETGRVKAFKLLTVAGAYWRGDEKRPMLQRIYATAFATAKELEEHLHKLEEAQRRDHRVLGKQLDLFHIDDEVGPGLPLWHPKGALLRKIIEDFWKDEHLKTGYELVMIPHIAKVDLWKTSGHWDFYRENMYTPMSIEGQDYIVKPMNCPGHIKIYQSRPRSYKDMPLRWAELGTVYRFERSGVLHGLLRVRGFTQDDAHIFCRLDQLEHEIVEVIKFVLFMLRTFGFDDYEVYLSTRPEKYVGTDDNWTRATDALTKALEDVGLKYEIDPGEGVFYGPKIDMKIRDALGRAWQCTTIQVDFNLPERFDVTYKGEDNADHRPIMIHRALLGSLERFIGCLIEHYAGAFPLWLAPEQATVIPIADRHTDYAEAVRRQLAGTGLRARVDQRSETVSRKIRDAQLQKVPYMMVVGDREEEQGAAAVRTRDGVDHGAMPITQIIDKLQAEAVPGFSTLADALEQ